MMLLARGTSLRVASFSFCFSFFCALMTRRPVGPETQKESVRHFTAERSRRGRTLLCEDALRYGEATLRAHLGDASTLPGDVDAERRFL